MLQSHNNTQCIYFDEYFFAVLEMKRAKREAFRNLFQFYIPTQSQRKKNETKMWFKWQKSKGIDVEWNWLLMDVKTKEHCKIYRIGICNEKWMKFRLKILTNTLKIAHWILINLWWNYFSCNCAIFILIHFS